MSLEKKEHKEFLVLYKLTRKDLSKYKFLPWKFNITHAIATILVFFLFVYKPEILIIDCEAFYSRCLIAFSYLIFSLTTIAVVFYSCHQFCYSKELLGKIVGNFSSEFREIFTDCQFKVKYSDKISFATALTLPFLSLLIISLAFGGRSLMHDFAIWLPVAILTLIIVGGCAKKYSYCAHGKKKSSSKH